VLASLRATVLPQFTVEVYFDCEPDCRMHPRYVLVLRDGTAGAVELEFASARDLRAFLARKPPGTHGVPQDGTDSPQPKQTGRIRNCTSYTVLSSAGAAGWPAAPILATTQRVS